MFKLFAVTGALLMVTASLCADEVVPIKKFSGTSRVNGLDSLAPASGVIAGQAELAKIWKSWAVADEMPAVDFKTHMVLVATVQGPNRTLSGPLNLVDGDLTYRVASTKMGGPGFGYLMMLVPREGIDRVNGQPVPRPALEGNGGGDGVADAIQVDVVGSVETGILAIGGETTGAVIRSNGITWELDFQTAKQVQFAKQLGAKKARVRGSYLQIDGIEVKSRSIVLVDSIELATKPRAADSPVAPITDRANRADGVSIPSAAELQEIRRRIRMRNSGAPSDESDADGASTGRTLPGERGGLQDPQPKPAIDVTKLNAFSQIKVEVTMDAVPGASVVQTVDAQGNTKAVGNGQELQWVVDPAKLRLIHTLVETTDWSKVERLNRSGVPDALNYTIEIAQPKTTTRIFVDSGALPSQPLLAKIFQLMQRPKDAAQSPSARRE